MTFNRVEQYQKCQLKGQNVAYFFMQDSISLVIPLSGARILGATFPELADTTQLKLSLLRTSHKRCEVLINCIDCFDDEVLNSQSSPFRCAVLKSQ